MKAAAKRKIGHTAKKESKRAVRTKKAKNPTFHHALLKTARMQEMIDWYAAVVGIEPVFQAPGIAFLSNDGANHRISMVGNPQFLTNPNFRKSVGMHHLAFEYESVDDLLDCWHRLHEEYGYKPHVAVHHGMTLSFYYADPENILLCGSREQQRRAAGGCVRRLEKIKGLDADVAAIPGRSDRAVCRSRGDVRGAICRS
jgi:catechol 2,3-dioxygenase-like lactoylglutathione lyase family enzyme